MRVNKAKEIRAKGMTGSVLEIRENKPLVRN
jgi:hypothetical protein